MEGSRPAQPAEPGTLKATLLETPGIENMTEKESAHPLSPPTEVNNLVGSPENNSDDEGSNDNSESSKKNAVVSVSVQVWEILFFNFQKCFKMKQFKFYFEFKYEIWFQKGGIRVSEQLSPNSNINQWVPSAEWVYLWKSKLPLQTIMRLLQVLVPQVEKICIDK